MLLIAHVTPLERDFGESLCTLQFAASAACVSQRAASSTRRPEAARWAAEKWNYTIEVSCLQQEVNRLRAKLEGLDAPLSPAADAEGRCNGAWPVSPSPRERRTVVRSESLPAARAEGPCRHRSSGGREAEAAATAGGSRASTLCAGRAAASPARHLGAAVKEN